MIKVIVNESFSSPEVGAWVEGEALMPEWIARKMAPTGLVTIPVMPEKKKQTLTKSTGTVTKRPRKKKSIK